MSGKEPSGCGRIKDTFISLLDASLYLHCIYIMVKQGDNLTLRRSKRTTTKPQIVITSKKQKECPQKKNPVNRNKSDSAEYGTNGIQIGAIGGLQNDFDVRKENPFNVSGDSDDDAVFGIRAIEPIFMMLVVKRRKHCHLVQ